MRATDPDAARERRVAAEDDRHIGINALDNGMAEVYGTAPPRPRRPSTDGYHSLPSRYDPRTLDQRRADALAAMTQGRRLSAPADNRVAPPEPATTTPNTIGVGRRWSSTS